MSPRRCWVPVAALLISCGDPGGQEEVGSETADTAGTADTGGELECDEGFVAGDDGACHCGGASGPLCSEEAFCDVES